MSNLKVKKETADLISLILLEIKDEFRNLDINDLKKSHDLVLHVCEIIELKIKNKTISKRTSKKLNKNQIVLLIFEELYKNKLNDEDINYITETIEFCINKKLINKRNFFSRILKIVLSFFISK